MNDNQGWTCPVCGRGNAPSVTTCPCKNNEKDKLNIDEIFETIRKIAKPLFQRMVEKI